MTKSIDVKGKSLDSCIEKGLKELGLTSREQIEFEVIKDNGILFNKFTVRVSEKKSISRQAEEFLENVIEKMGLVFSVEATEDDEQVFVDLIGVDGNIIIGRHGEVLDALQLLSNLVINKTKENYKRINVDSENYRAKREEALKELARNLENKCNKTGKRVRLEPMNPYERLIIHSTLQDSELVTTQSEGNAPYRYVVIHPKNPSYDKKKKKDKQPHKKNNQHFDNNKQKTTKSTEIIQNTEKLIATDEPKQERKQLNIVYSSTKKRR